MPPPCCIQDKFVLTEKMSESIKDEKNTLIKTTPLNLVDCNPNWKPN